MLFKILPVMALRARPGGWMRAVDAGTGYAVAVTFTSANVHDICELHRLVRDGGTVVFWNHWGSGNNRCAWPFSLGYGAVRKGLGGIRKTMPSIGTRARGGLN